MFRPSPRFHMNVWDAPMFEHVPLLRYWKKMVASDGSTLSVGSIPRYIHGYTEATNQRTESTLRWFPYKKEMTVNGVVIPTFTDVLYQHYFPPLLTDDERVKYVAMRTARSELEVAEELFMMRKIKLFCAQLLRNKLKNRPLRLPMGMNYSGLERHYVQGVNRCASVIGMSMYASHGFDPVLIYSPQYGLSECVDMIMYRPSRTTQQYIMCEIVVHRGIAKSRFAQTDEDPRPPLQHLEPSVFEAIKLKMAVCAILAKMEHYVTDHQFDTGHRYAGCLIHFFPSLEDPTFIEHTTESIELDLDLGHKWLEHYHENFVAPLEAMTRR